MNPRICASVLPVAVVMMLAVVSAPEPAAAGEVLYNAIELPEAWPPSEVHELNREVQPVPYLKDRPEVVPINLGRQLFVDDFLIERNGLRREWHYPVKYAGNPVLKPETMLEINRPSNSCARACCGGVWWDPTRKKFRMWYEAGWLGSCAYAESPDGYNWTRVNHTVRPGTNALFPEGTVRFDSWIVTPDFKAPDPYSRWLLFVRPPGPSAQKSYVAVSTNGLDWSELMEAGECGDRSTAFYNPFRGKWVYSLRSEMGPWGQGGSRCRSYREVDDFIKDSQWKFFNYGSTEDVVMWLQPDKLEPRSSLWKLPAQIYNFDAVAYESVMVGAYSIWRGPENCDTMKHAMPKITDIEFGFSRDGFHFFHEDRTPAVASEGWDSGRWDAGYVQSMPNVFVVKDEKLLFFYSGTKGNRDRKEIGGFSADLNGAYDGGASGIAVLRRDGFASLRPKVGERGGDVLTRPVRFSGKYLFINAQLRKGTLKAEVLDADSKVIPGYSQAESVPFTGDSVKYRLGWRGKSDLSELAGKTVRFRFVIEGAEMNRGDFYSFWVSPSERGESRGYLGGGGPGYGSVRDM